MYNVCGTRCARSVVAWARSPWGGDEEESRRHDAEPDWARGQGPPHRIDGPDWWGPAGTMGMVCGCALPGDRISSSSSCVRASVCVVLYVSVFLFVSSFCLVWCCVCACICCLCLCMCLCVWCLCAYGYADWGPLLCCLQHPSSGCRWSVVSTLPLPHSPLAIRSRACVFERAQRFYQHCGGVR